MPDSIFKTRFMFLGVIIFGLFYFSNVYAGNPASPILPSDNIQDPGDPGTAWGGCGPTDSNCYVTVTFPISIQNTTSLFSTGLSGTGSGSSATDAIFFGTSAGSAATSANNSNFLGNSAGSGATNSEHSNFFGANAGLNASDAYMSNFIGRNTGNGATNAFYSNFIGFLSGYQATGASQSNFIGIDAGREATNASLSNFLGYSAGKSFVGNNLGSNNIIIGTNISLPNATADSINIGGVLFGTGTYSNIGTNPLTTPVSGGRIGIGTSSPSSKLDVTTTSLGVTQTDTSGLALVNTTAASVGAQQISPAIRWSGNGWATTGGASQSVAMRSYLIPIQGTSATSKLVFEGFRNGSSQGIGLELYDNGRINLLAALLLNGSLGNSGYVFTSSAGGLNAWTPPSTIVSSGLSIGSGTTPNGAGVDLGGTLSADTTINAAGYSFKISNTERGNGFLSDFTTRTTKIGDVDGIDLGNIIVVDSVNSIAYYDNIAHTGKFGIGNASPSLMLHVGSANIADATNLLRLEDENSTCDFNADAGGPSCGSDRTLKKDITSLNTVDLLARVSALNPVSYKWNTDNENDPIKYGFVAQEVAEQFPDLVTDHNWIDGTTRKFLNTVGLTPYAIGAIKELNLKVTGIENFDQENNSFGEKMRAWFANASNKIIRIFTGEICLTDPDGTSECINKTQLGQLKQLLNSQNPPTTNSVVTDVPPPSNPTLEAPEETPPVIEDINNSQTQ